MDEKLDKKSKEKKKIILLILLVILLVTGGYFTYKIFFNQSKETARVIAGDFLPKGKDASKMTDDEILQLAQQEVEKNSFNMRIVSEAHFNKETMKGGLAIQNPPQNKQPINVVVTLDSDKSKVYESGAIQPEEQIRSATLTKKLDPGSYPATATFKIYDPDTKKQKGKVEALITLIVDN